MMATETVFRVKCDLCGSTFGMVADTPKVARRRAKVNAGWGRHPLPRTDGTYRYMDLCPVCLVNNTCPSALVSDVVMTFVGWAVEATEAEDEVQS